MIFLSLEKGRITLKDEGGQKRTFRRDAYKTIGTYLAKRPGWGFLISSSVNHPQEYGFPRNFDVQGVMAKAVEHAYRKLAIVVLPIPLQKAPETIEAAAKTYPHDGLVPLLLKRAGKKREDVLLALSRDELENFLLGVRYSANLAELAALAARALLKDSWARWNVFEYLELTPEGEAQYERGRMKGWHQFRRFDPKGLRV